MHQYFQRSGKTYLMGAARVPQNLSTFLRAQRHPNETAAIQQSSLQPESDPLLAIPHSVRRIIKPGLTSVNAWVYTETSRTSLHYDISEGLLVQLVGRKHVTLVDPDTLHALVPDALELVKWVRVSPGNFTRQVTSNVQQNFALTDLSNPSVPGQARVHSLWLEEGDGLILPARWSHEVMTYGSDHAMNIAVNYWFD